MASGYISEIDDMAELVSALKCTNQYNLDDMEFYIIENIIYLLDLDDEGDDFLADDQSSDAFASLPFNLIRKVFLFDLTIINPDGLPTTKQRFESFKFWLSENEVTEEQKDEIVESLDFEDFTVEELLTSVKKSGLYTVSKIGQRTGQTCGGPKGKESS